LILGKSIIDDYVIKLGTQGLKINLISCSSMNISLRDFFTGISRIRSSFAIT